MREIWEELYPDKPWQGIGPAGETMAQEIRAMRGTLLRPVDEIQRAHDIVGQYAVETRDHGMFEHVSALCWVLKHDHNTTFPQILESIEQELARKGIAIVRLPEVVDPAKER